MNCLPRDGACAQDLMPSYAPTDNDTMYITVNTTHSGTMFQVIQYGTLSL